LFGGVTEIKPIHDWFLCQLIPRCWLIQQPKALQCYQASSRKQNQQTAIMRHRSPRDFSHSDANNRIKGHKPQGLVCGSEDFHERRKRRSRAENFFRVVQFDERTLAFG